MGDMFCRLCGEPWDSYGVYNGDMTVRDKKQFLAGKGCPGCGFGNPPHRCYYCLNETGIGRCTVGGDPDKYRYGSGRSCPEWVSRVKLSEDHTEEFMFSAAEETDDPDAVTNAWDF